MNFTIKRTRTIESISLLFIVLFLYTAGSKIMDFSIFKEQIALSPLLHPFAKWIAIVLPSLEIIASILLFIPLTRYFGLYASFILMLLFTGYIIYILNFNEHLPCTCGGIIQKLSWKQHLFLNIALIILSLTAIILGKKDLKK